MRGSLSWQFIPKVRPSLYLAGLLGMVVAIASPEGWGEILRALVGWDAAVLFWLSAITWMTRRVGPQELARRPAQYDVGWMISLAVVSAAILASLGAIVHVLSGVRNLPVAGKAPHMLVSTVTIALSWTALHTLYGLHYARQYYSRHQRGVAPQAAGLDFPGTEQPLFSDFFYFAFTIGATSQTSDVAVSSSRMRRSVLVHACLSFAFNTALLALTINIAASLL